VLKFALKILLVLELEWVLLLSSRAFASLPRRGFLRLLLLASVSVCAFAIFGAQEDHRLMTADVIGFRALGLV
jgi:hypothetical protein